MISPYLFESLQNRNIKHELTCIDGRYFITITGTEGYQPRSWEDWITGCGFLISIYCPHQQLHSSKEWESVTYDLGTVFDLIKDTPDNFFDFETEPHTTLFVIASRPIFRYNNKYYDQ